MLRGQGAFARGPAGRAAPPHLGGDRLGVVVDALQCRVQCGHVRVQVGDDDGDPLAHGAATSWTAAVLSNESSPGRACSPRMKWSASAPPTIAQQPAETSATVPIASAANA